MSKPATDIRLARAAEGFTEVIIVGRDTQSIKFPWHLFFEQTLTAGWSKILWQ